MSRGLGLTLKPSCAMKDLMVGVRSPDKGLMRVPKVPKRQLNPNIQTEANYGRKNLRAGIHTKPNTYNTILKEEAQSRGHLGRIAMG